MFLYYAHVFVSEFETARGHKMERELYVEDIRNNGLSSRFDEPYSYTSRRSTTSHIPRRDNRYRNNDHYGQSATRWEQPRDRYNYNRTNSQRSHRSQRELPQSWRNEQVSRREVPVSWRDEQVKNKHIRFSHED